MSDKGINSKRWMEVTRVKNGVETTVKVRKKFNTDQELKAWKPESKRFEVSDAQTAGLRLRVDPNGKRSFVWYYRENRKQHLKVIGSYPETSLKDARSKLGSEKAKLSSQEHKAEDIPQTVRELAERFYEKRIVPHRKRPDVVRQILDHDILPAMGDITLLTVTPITVNRMIETVVNRADVHAGKVLAITKQMFGYGVGLGYMDVSPAHNQKPKDLGIKESKPRDRHLTADEIKEFWEALDDRSHRMSDPVRHALKILMLSGVRSNEIRLAKWKHINLDEGTWFIPAENSKTDAAWVVPLTSQLIDQFRALQSLSGASEWVVKSAGAGAITDKVFGRSVHRLFDNELLTCEKFTPHDLRRTLRTGLSVLKVDYIIAEKCLNHSLGKIEKTYNLDDTLEPRMEALQKWNDYIDLVVVERENVVMMDRSA